MSQVLQAPDEATAAQMLERLGRGDGLPIVVPTIERVDAMCAAVDLDREAVLGVVPLRGGVATVETVAANAVMAGCVPAHFGLVCASVRAVCAPVFALDVVQATTHNAAVLTIVNGAVRLADPPLRSSTGALGPGNRGNVTIGRALRLVLMNAGGAHPGAGDMSTLGQPAKLTCCLAEAEEASPFAPLSVARGLSPGQPAVTVIAVEGPRQVMFVPVGDASEADAERLLTLIAASIASPGALAAMGYAGSAAVVLCPLHADVLAAAGFDRATISAELHRRATLARGDVERLHGYVRGGAAHAAIVHALSSPDHVVVAVAGGAGTYSAVFCGLAEGAGPAVTVSA